MNGVGFTIGQVGFGADLRFGPIQGFYGSPAGPWIPPFKFNIADWTWADTLSETFQKAEAYKASITTSRELPGSTHWDPAAVPVGKKGNGAPPGGAVIYSEGGPVSVLDILPWLPSPPDKREPSVTYVPPPIILPGQVDPGREEHETEGEDMAHTWTHVGSQFIGALFPNTVAAQSFVAGPGQVTPGLPTQSGAGLPAPGPIPGTAMYSGGTCPPRKTRTLTIDCETGQEIKRKRRRRPKLLTNGDMGMLFQIASLPNNANVRIALAGAIRR